MYKRKVERDAEVQKCFDVIVDLVPENEREDIKRALNWLNWQRMIDKVEKELGK